MHSTCHSNAAILLVLGILALQRVDTSIIYHMVRGQSILKLYVIFNMLDIFERLLTSVGQDTLDSLYWLAVDRFCGEPGRRRRKRDAVNLVLHFLISNVYVCILFITKYSNGEHCGRSSALGIGESSLQSLYTSSSCMLMMSRGGSAYARFRVEHLSVRGGGGKHGCLSLTPDC